MDPSETLLAALRETAERCERENQEAVEAALDAGLSATVVMGILAAHSGELAAQIVKKGR